MSVFCISLNKDPSIKMDLVFKITNSTKFNMATKHFCVDPAWFPLLSILFVALSFFYSNPPHFFLDVIFVCFSGVVSLREQCACYSGSNVITLYKLGVTEAGGVYRLMTFYCYCSASINCSPLLLQLLRALTSSVGKRDNKADPSIHTLCAYR